MLLFRLAISVLEAKCESLLTFLTRSGRVSCVFGNLFILQDCEEIDYLCSPPAKVHDM